MNLNITNTPDSDEEEFVIASLWKHNEQFDAVDISPLFLNFKDDENNIIAGLISRTWWGALEVQYLWVSEKHRKSGLGRQLMQAAEKEALNRGCHLAYVDTFEFQAKGFYEKLGYREYGNLPGYAHKHTRHYLAKLIR
ncbi:MULTISPECIES: GNAT family N-acetyltransferase [Pectobacterium]|uniref:GNAT family N-acetyltransferase n=1 Tax=Pectobacterium TaxID=122277 RepID=UPI0015F03C1D|nr:MULTISPECIES: GNAT family N-acetyltransferase [Pectobacterium]MBA5235714.1 GNAT family N-acetyltransferase [Pectobacterium aroidearum]QPI42273.1 GNAT family N-acetyltransferase [Pectobacterium aroidearum]UUE35511.1 GNAT family N-acetyltransferase [Pectobacterium aroidearum]UUE39885.1 GNAT family N-acetyltransferase [Pectobacterium aroidearum]UUE44211.1 GNAT family N-acetyltransferase [Pectobacterium aroidearum]